MFEIGDWVQAIAAVTEHGFLGGEPWVHARQGAIGHVIGFEDGWPDIHWEHSGTGTLVDPDNLRFLCDAEGTHPGRRVLRLSGKQESSRC